MATEEDIDIKKAVHDFAVVACVGLIVLFLELFGQPTNRGFFCDDDSIKYPYKPNTVTETTIIIAAILIPFFWVLLTELWTHGVRSRNRINFWKLSCPVWVQTILQFYGVYLLGIGFSQVASEVGKFTIGRLRPHFLAACVPNVTCSNDNMHQYIQDFVCLGDVDEAFEARLSFPSGHATLSFYASVYLIAYMQSSPTWARFGFARHFIQFLFLLSAWFVGLSRVMDNWHHWSDVLAGSCLGAFTAMAVIKYASHLRITKDGARAELLPLRKSDSSSYIPPSPS